MAFMWLGRNVLIEEVPVGRWDPDPTRPGRWLYDPYGVELGQLPAITDMMPVVIPYPDVAGLTANPLSETAGEQDHTDPWVFAGDDAEAPVSP